MNQESGSFEKVDRIFGYQIDRLIFIAPFAYVWDVFTGGAENLSIAVLLWLFITIIWTPWTIFRVAMQKPRGDAYVATAVLGLGLWPWLIFLFAIDWSTTRAGLLVTFPLVFLFGGGTLLAASLGWPKLRTAGARSNLLMSGAVAYAIFATLFIGALFLGIAQAAGFLTVGIVAIGGTAAIAAMNLFTEASRPAPKPPS